MRYLFLLIVFFTLFFFAFCIEVIAQPSVTFWGSPDSMDWQYNTAEGLDLTHSDNGWVLAKLVNEGVLVEVLGNENYELYDVSFPFALPHVRNFIEDLANHYRNVFCGEKMVVTSLTRPKNMQPPNSHPLSVHPTGMAVDLRWPDNPNCNDFLERILLHFEKYGKVDVTRESRPPHYHVAILSEDF